MKPLLPIVLFALVSSPMLQAAAAPSSVGNGPTSGFGANAEGWMIVEMPGPPYDSVTATFSPTYAATGGNPGGAISTKDRNAALFLFSAPSGFLGDQAKHHGGVLSYDLLFTNNGLPPGLPHPDIVLEGNGMTLVADAFSDPSSQSGVWMSYEIPLSLATDWRLDSLSGTQATDQDLLAVLTSLSGLYIRGDYWSGLEETKLDNPTLNEPIPGIATARLGAPSNPNAFHSGTTRPIVGQTWDPVIDHATFAPSAFLDFVGISLQGPANLPTALGTLLILPPFENPVIFNASPGTPFAIPIPNDCSFVGLPVWTQGGSVSPGPVIELANALDLVLGNV